VLYADGKIIPKWSESGGAAKSAARGKNAAALSAFLLPLEILPFDGQSAMAYGEIRSHLEQQGQLIGSLDMLIAAQAVAHKLTLVSNNLKEFERVPDLLCANWVD
jgi:tRNA(fMet)-specific endonuclease VapC